MLFIIKSHSYFPSTTKSILRRLFTLFRRFFILIFLGWALTFCGTILFFACISSFRFRINWFSSINPSLYGSCIVSFHSIFIFLSRFLFHCFFMRWAFCWCLFRFIFRSGLFWRFRTSFCSRIFWIIQTLCFHCCCISLNRASLGFIPRTSIFLGQSITCRLCMSIAIPILYFRSSNRFRFGFIGGT